MIINTINIIIPIIRLPPPTNSPKVLTTSPASPSLNISFVDETLSEILKIVVNNNKVGNEAISRTSLANNVLNKITIATPILNASNISNNHDGIEIMKNNTAERRYIPMNRSFFFIFITYFPLSLSICIS